MTLYRSLDDTSVDLREWATSDHARIPTGFPFIDRLTRGGISEGEVGLLAAYSGVGKTALGCNVVINNQGVPTVFFSLEMQARFILKRLAAIYSECSDARIENAIRNGGNCPPVDLIVRDFQHLSIVDQPGMSLRDMGTALDEAAGAWGKRPRLVVIDFLELVGGFATTEGVSSVDKISRKTKDFARAHDVAVLMLHQLNQGGAAHLPVKIKDLRYGGNVSADYVISAFRPCLDPELSYEMYKAREREMGIQFLKTRAGPEIHPSPVMHDYDPPSMKVKSLEQKYQQEKLA